MSNHLPQTLIATSQDGADLHRLIQAAAEHQGTVQQYLVCLAGVATHLDSYDKADLGPRIGAFSDSVDKLTKSLSDVIKMLEEWRSGTRPTESPEEQGFTPGP